MDSFLRKPFIPLASICQCQLPSMISWSPIHLVQYAYDSGIIYSLFFFCITVHSFFYDMQIDTKNILFICGGAFINLEKTISERYFVFLFMSLFFHHILIICEINQTTRFFNWFWITSPFQYENWWSYKCCSHIIFTWVGENSLWLSD